MENKKYYRYPCDYEMNEEEKNHDEAVHEAVKNLITLMSEGQSFEPDESCVEIVRSVVGFVLEQDYGVSLDEIICSIYPEGELVNDGVR